MCTIVAILRPNATSRILFLENRDMPGEYRTDDLRVIDGVVSIYDHRSSGIVCGYSTGTGIFGGLANVLGYMGPLSRGKLLREVLTSSKTLEGALQNLTARLRGGMYSSANYLLGDMEGLYRIESFGREVHVEESNSYLIITNNHRHLQGSTFLESSRAREAFLETYLRARGTVTAEEMAALSARHSGPASICRHDDRATLSSLLFSVGGRAEFLYSSGNPCRNRHRRMEFAVHKAI